jgi:predicted CoA-binding protein
MTSSGAARAIEPAAPPAEDDYSDDFLLDIFRKCRVFAMVGASPNWNRPSYFAMKYMQIKKYRVIPVNPTALDAPILGEKVYASLKDIPFEIDLVDIFRRSEAVPPLVDDAVAIGAKVVWMQLGIRNEAAARKAEAAGLKVVMNRCVKIEFGRLAGELSWGGINSGIISSKRRKLIA